VVSLTNLFVTRMLSNAQGQPARGRGPAARNKDDDVIDV
jgi:hypothetical protein